MQGQAQAHIESLNCVPQWVTEFSGLAQQVGLTKLKEAVRAHERLANNPSALRIVESLNASSASNIRYLSVKQVSERTGLSVSYWNQLRGKNGGPRFQKIGGGKVVYLQEQVDEWMESHSIASTAEGRIRPDLRGKTRVGKGEKRTKPCVKSDIFE